MRVLHMLSLETTMLLAHLKIAFERKLEIHLAFSEPPQKMGPYAAA
jgi:hypothetical protein